MSKTAAIIITSLAISFAWIGQAQDKTEAEKKWGPSPSKDFVEGFEKGVRYGLLARMDHPNENDIPTLTKQAVAWYVFVERNGWKASFKGH